LSLEGRRVLVTGAGGFIGSHLAERLVREGARVRALVHYNSLGHRGWLEESSLLSDMDVVTGDVAQSDSVASAMKEVEVVFHLAALIGIPYSYRTPRSYLAANVEGTLNVLEQARAAGDLTVVHTSTSEVYGSAVFVPMTEEHPLVGQSPYAATKIAADKLVEAFHRSFGVPTVTVRPFNTFGPRQSLRAVIPTVIAQCMAGGPIRLGNLHPVRDFNYVDNTVEGFLLAADAGKRVAGATMNLASGRGVAIGELVALVQKLLSVDLPVVVEDERRRPEASEVDRLVGDASKAQRLLGWTPQTSLEEGVGRTADWVAARGDGYRFRGYAV
jgi:NAD dependent epimerase/dehydratase